MSYTYHVCAQTNYSKVPGKKNIPQELLSLGDDDDVMRFGTLEINPMFPGGPEAWQNWIGKNLFYPQEALKKKVGGTVIVTFIVEKDGSITDIWVRESVDPVLDKEAIRVAKKMPRWNPGFFNGEPVRVRYNLPLTFELKGVTIPKKSVLVTPQDLVDDDHYVKKQPRKVAGFDNNSFNVIYFSDNDVLSVNGNSILSGADSVVAVKSSPASNGVIVQYRKGRGRQYGVISHFLNGNVSQTSLKNKKESLTSACYRPDARRLALAMDNKKIVILNAVNDTVVETLQSSFAPQHITYNESGNILVASANKSIEIWNMERSALRKTLTMTARVNDIAFADNDRKMLVVTDDGQLTVFDTSSFAEVLKYKGMGIAKRCRSIGDGKYAAVLASDMCVWIVNLFDTKDVMELYIGHGNTTDIGIAEGFDGDNWVIYNSNIDLVYSAIGYSRIKGMKPYFRKMMEEQLASELNLWMKKMPNETLEEYRLRVNEESRTAKSHELSLRFGTKMAEGVIDEPVLTLGDYNTTNGQLALHLGKMPDIFINVPSEEIGSIAAGSNKVKLKNVKYTITENDLFEVAYAEILNETNGKVYVFDKMKMDPSELTKSSSKMVPIDIIMKANMDELSLVNIKDEVISLAKQDQIISDNTHISVVAQVSPGVSADGEQILNYDVNFTYEVDQEFSSRDDFKPGRFRTEESGAAMSMLKIMKKAFETDFAKYIKEGKRVKFSITGTADASPIVRTIGYDGEYGEFVGEPVYKGSMLESLSLTREGGISDNDQLAFARAIGVQQYLEKELLNFKSMKRDYDYHVDVSKKEGSQYRRISVQCSFIDAF
ncbi:MAG: TonB family protein [Prevotella sp.]|nr:TonB family protein [Prevotella sp.]